MPRVFYLIGWGYVLVALVTIGRPGSSMIEPPGIHLPAYTGPANGWFERVKPRCNALEVEVMLRRDPPPSSTEGMGFAAACWALAGRIERARSTIEALPSDERASAAHIVFAVGHPVADAGDDASAGPIMRLVVEHTPWNYMAQYHAGMSYYVLGEEGLAQEHLGLFLDQYSADDGWRSNAIEVLSRMGTVR